MATIKDVAKLAGVSISTASLALNDLPNVSKKTKAKVLKAAEELGYHPNLSARSLKTNKTGNIGVFIYGFGGPIFSDLLETIHMELLKEGLNLVVSTGKSSSELLKNRQVDGVIIFDTKITDEEIISFAKNKPVIVLDRNLDHPNVYSSVVKNKQMVYELIKEMIKRGYKKFSYASGPKRTKDNQDRYEGFLKALDEQNIVPHLQFVGNFTIESGYSIGESIAKIEDKPDFIFCANDEMAVGLIRALKDNKIHIPQQIAVAGFDGIYLGDYITPKLTTIKVDYLNWGVYISQKMILLIKGHDVYEMKEPKAEIIYKKSTQ